MAHHGHDRRTRLQFVRIVALAAQTFEHVGFSNTLDGMAELGGDQFGGIRIDGVVGGRHHAAFHQDLDDVHTAPRHAVGEFGNRNGFGNDDFAWTCDRRGLLLAVGAIELPPERGDGPHALLVVREGAGDGELSGAPASGCRFPGGRSLGRRPLALLGGCFLIFLSQIPGAFNGRRRGRSSDRSGRFSLFLFFLQPADSFLLGAAARFFFGVLARLFFGFALFGGFAFAPDALFFNGAAARFFLGVLASFFFSEFGVGQRSEPRFLFILCQLAQDNPATIGSRAARFLRMMEGVLDYGMFGGRVLGLRRSLAGHDTGALLLDHDRFAAAMAEALTNRRGFRALQRQRFAAARTTATPARSRTAIIRLAHSTLSCIPKPKTGPPAAKPARSTPQKTLPRPRPLTAESLRAAAPRR